MKMPKIFHIRDDLTPRSLKDIKDQYRRRGEEEKWQDEALRSILGQFIKCSEVWASHESRFSIKRKSKTICRGP